MHRVPPLRAAVAGLLLALLAVPTAARAQHTVPSSWRGSDETAPLPEGATMEPLAVTRIDALPAEPADVALVRITLDPGAGFPIKPIEPNDPSLVVVRVESGELTLRYAAAVEMLATPRVAAWDTIVITGPDSIIGLPTWGSELRNDGAAPVELLVLSVVPTGAAGVAPPAPAAGDAEESQAPVGLRFQPLAFGHVEELPAGPWSLAIARLTAEPGVFFPADDTTSGRPAGRATEVELVAVEAGSLAFTTTGEPSLRVARGLANLDVFATPGPEPIASAVGPGEAATVGAGDGVFVPLGNVSEAEVVGDEPAVVVLAFVASASAPGLTGRR
jgi:hypothetical protein